ncbi:hypothetical protein DMA15_16305 [Streptomyces sp. WAC 01529]|uniref:hypothetical protein n=1 Tax=Streptomyces sp. WAC 01529 TaxID=2203205 RepID=UPI000F71FA98|nr:hypothetical protein [Streptomyces sp. WAC 01529]AZM53940.1 hypothetical protein DMA15_16305 [Streptomyces sp. WAC 01529]
MEEAESRAAWAARNAAYAAAHPVPRPSRVLALALATPTVALLLALGWLIVALDASIGSASSPEHQELVARYVLAAFGGLGCLTAGWLTPRVSRAAWLRTAFACTSVAVIPAAMLAGA